MRFGKSGGVLVAGSLVLLGLMAPGAAQAGRHRASAHVAHGGSRLAGRHAGWSRQAWRGGHLQCVPFARTDSGIELKGNASIWWNEAAGRYQRGNRPEPGSVLSFSAQGRMRLGHVAVVSQIVNAREIEIDHANWWGPGSQGGVNRSVPVVDVSPGNDWTEVRVALGNGEFGSVYRTHGFIYDRPDDGTLVAANAPAAPFGRPAAGAIAVIGAALAQPMDRLALNDEVAEAPDETSFRTTRWAHGLQGGFGARLRQAGYPHAGAAHARDAHPRLGHSGRGRSSHAARAFGRHRG